VPTKKKSYIARFSHISSPEEKGVDDLSNVTMENWDEFDSENQVDSVSGSENSLKEKKIEIFIKKIYLAPAGYPIKPFDAPDRLLVTVNNEKLFQAYASEQWLGLAVKKSDFIFDQLIIPDFAFEVKKILPKNAHRIGQDTNFILIQPDLEKPRFAPVKFDEIIGNQPAKDKAEIIIQYLKKPKSFGEWAPKNILFHGQPGTGKTLSAKAIATASNCAFFAYKGSSLIGLHVGDGASKIYKLYKKAKEYAPSIVFIDELDSIGLNRSYQNVRGDVVEVSTALLAELDGLESNEGVITIGATNGLELLDPGLRSRFEEEIDFVLPNESERVDMLKLFVKKIPFPVNIDFSIVAKHTEKWSGRDLHEKLIKIAVHRNMRKKTQELTTKMLLDIIKNVKGQKDNNQPPSEFFA
jgi:AAA family ATPase